jgi:hypothetical protein
MKKPPAEKLLLLNPEAILFDSRFNSAILGIGYSANKPPVAIYSKHLIYGSLTAAGIAALDIADYYRWHFELATAGENAPVIFDDTLTEDI